MSETSGDGRASKGEVGGNVGDSKGDARGRRKASQARAPRVGGVSRTLTRIVVYYVVLLGAGAILLWRYPWLTQAFIEVAGDAVLQDEITST